VCEIVVGLWLAASPWVLGHASEPLSQARLVVHDLVVAGVVIGLSALSFRPRTRRAHLGLLVVAAWLLLRGYFLAETPPSAATQNHLVVALTLLMFAILPNEASQPPRGWRELRRARAASREPHAS
jgi:hypothetical protein